MVISAPIADRPYSGLAVRPNGVREVCDTGIGPDVGIAFMPYTRPRVTNGKTDSRTNGKT